MTVRHLDKNDYHMMDARCADYCVGVYYEFIAGGCVRTNGSAGRQRCAGVSGPPKTGSVLLCLHLRICEAWKRLIVGCECERVFPYRCVRIIFPHANNWTY